MLLPRSERPDYEEHPSRINIARPAWSMYYRPRRESAEIEKIGIESKSVSFHFLDIAMEDLGRWVGPLVSEGWQRGEVVVCAADSGSFEDEKWTCFHHPFIPTPTRLPLIDAPTKLDVNCYIHQPTGAIKPAIPVVSVPKENPTLESPAVKELLEQEKTVQQKTVAEESTQLGEDNSNQRELEQEKTVQEKTVAEESTQLGEDNSHPAELEPRVEENLINSVQISEPEIDESERNTESSQPNVTTVAERTDEGEADEKPADSSAAKLENPQSESWQEPTTESAEESQSESLEESESFGQDDEYEPPVESETQIKLRQMIQLLKADGLDVASIMSNENFLEISEIATIEGIDVWSMVIAD